MTDHNKAILHRWFQEVWNHNNPAIIDELFHPEGKCYGFPDAASAITPAEFKQAHKDFTRTFSNIHVHLDEVTAEGDTATARWTATMTHTGDGLGFPGTGKPVTLHGSSSIHCHHGMITAGWNHFDLTRVAEQLRIS